MQRQRHGNAHPPSGDTTARNAGLQTGTAALRAAHVATQLHLTARNPHPRRRHNGP